MKLSKYFTVEEFTYSSTAIKKNIVNDMDEYEFLNAKALCTVLDKLREAINKPLIITSGFRCKELEMLISGSTNSQHLRGQAVDFICKHHNNEYLFYKFLELKLPFDQLILEFPPSGWVHLSYCKNGFNRGQKLKAIKRGLNISYLAI